MLVVLRRRKLRGGRRRGFEVLRRGVLRLVVRRTIFTSAQISWRVVGWFLPFSILYTTWIIHVAFILK